MRAAGVPVELETAGDLTTLPSGVDLAAYRIVQEALTNVLTHAGPVSTRVCIRVGGGAVEVEMRDDGRGEVGAPGFGHGLVGMRERAALYGGQGRAGPMPGGGFRVHARLTVDGGTA
jgi:signal transduction histidine kinase